MYSVYKYTVHRYYIWYDIIKYLHIYIYTYLYSIVFSNDVDDILFNLSVSVRVTNLSLIESLETKPKNTIEIFDSVDLGVDSIENSVCMFSPPFLVPWAVMNTLILVRIGPLPRTLTTRSSTCLVGCSYKPSFAIVIGGGHTQVIIHIYRRIIFSLYRK